MKKLTLWFSALPLWASVAGGLSVSCRPSATEGDTLVCTALAPLDRWGGQGVSAPYAGRIGQALVVAGGCNFPDVPAADGGGKVFYRDVWRLPAPADPSSRWEHVGECPVAAAYGVSVTVPQGLICIGGTDGHRSLDGVWLLRPDGVRGYAADSLPSLPVGLDNAAGAWCAGAVYVAGGQTDGAPSLRAYRLAWPGGTRWEEIPVPPGGARLQPVAMAVGSRFYLMGGYVPPSDGEPGRLQPGGCVYDTVMGRWSETAALMLPGDTLPRALVGGVGAVSPDGRRLLVAGGVDAGRFLRAVNRPLLLKQARAEGNDTLADRLEAEGKDYLRHPVAWYRFSECLLSYDPTSDSWQLLGRNPRLARAGAALVSWEDRWYVVNGENKPGIRSGDVSLFVLPLSVRGR